MRKARNRSTHRPLKVVGGLLAAGIVTLAMLAVYRVGVFITIPNVLCCRSVPSLTSCHVFGPTTEFQPGCE